MNGKEKYLVHFQSDPQITVKEFQSKLDLALKHDPASPEFALFYPTSKNYVGIQKTLTLRHRTASSANPQFLSHSGSSQPRIQTERQVLHGVGQSKCPHGSIANSSLQADSVFLSITASETALKSTIVASSNAMINEVYNIFVSKHQGKILRPEDFALHEVFRLTDLPRTRQACIPH